MSHERQLDLAVHTRGGKRSARWGKPQDLPHMPPLKYQGKVYDTWEGKVRVYRESAWGDKTSDGDDVPSLPLPAAGPHRSQHPSVQKLQDGELAGILKKLPTKKSAGPDGVANEVLKMSQEVLLPYLELLFNACLSLAHHPA